MADREDLDRGLFGVCGDLVKAGLARLVPDYFGPNAAYYDLVQSFDDDVGFYVERARSLGGPVLELGCGTGRVLLPLARAGLDVTGLDASPDMLQVCRTKLAAEPGEIARRVKLVCGDMRSARLDDRFGLALVPLYTLNHLLVEEDKLSTFGLCARHLHDGGWFIIDAELDGPLPEHRGLELTLQRVDRTGRRALLGFSQARRLHDGTLLLNFLNLATDSGGHTDLWVTASRESRTSAGELEALLRATGFEITSIACDYRGTALLPDARSAVIQARKVGPAVRLAG